MAAILHHAHLVLATPASSSSSPGGPALSLNRTHGSSRYKLIFSM